MLSENIKNLRKQKGFTQETLAQSLNIVRQTVSKWEKGYSVPDADMLEKLAEVLDVSVTDLLGGPAESGEKATDMEKIASQLAILNDQMAREVGRKRRTLKTVLAVIFSVIALAILVTGILFMFFGLDTSKGPVVVDNVEVTQAE